MIATPGLRAAADLARLMAALDGARTLNGPLTPELRQRIATAALEPSPDNWHAARSVIIGPSIANLWSTVVALGWPEDATPDGAMILRALESAAPGDDSTTPATSP